MCMCEVQKNLLHIEVRNISIERSVRNSNHDFRIFDDMFFIFYLFRGCSDGQNIDPILIVIPKIVVFYSFQLKFPLNCKANFDFYFLILFLCLKDVNV